jgi:GST-like protein
METKRQLDASTGGQKQSSWAATLHHADMAVAVVGGLAKGLLYGGGEFLSVQDYKNVQRWTDTIAQRPAVKRGRIVNRLQGDPANQLHERHDTSDFELRTQDKVAAKG